MAQSTRVSHLILLCKGYTLARRYLSTGPSLEPSGGPLRHASSQVHNRVYFLQLDDSENEAREIVQLNWRFHRPCREGACIPSGQKRFQAQSLRPKEGS